MTEDLPAIVENRALAAPIAILPAMILKVQMKIVFLSGAIVTLPPKSRSCKRRR